MTTTYRATELLGDGIGEELRQAVHQVAAALPFRIELDPVDLSVANRERRGQALYEEAFQSIKATRHALKYPTATVKESPNQVLRKMCDFSVIHRPVVTIPGVKTNFAAPVDLDIVRVAVGGTYDDPGQMIGRNVAVSLRVVEREPVRRAAKFAFELAKRTGKNVTSASKFTIQRVTDGLFESVVAEVQKGYPDVPQRQELFDALLAKIVLNPTKFSIIVVLNEYGDFLSDMACGLVGSLGLGASGNYGFDESGRVDLAMFDAAHGTAPDIAGQGKANPTAIFLAFSLMLYQLGETRAASALKNATLELLQAGTATPDLGGTLSTRAFTERVAEKMVSHLADQAWVSRTRRLTRTKV